MRTIYIDLDDTIADFRIAAENLLGRKLAANSRGITDDEWKIIGKQKNFFQNLPVRKGANELIRTAKKYADCFDVKFLSTIPKKDGLDGVLEDKLTWCTIHFPGIELITVNNSNEKSKYCGKLDILIDDKYDVCNSWHDHGGLYIIAHDLTRDVIELDELANFVSMMNKSKPSNLAEYIKMSK